MSVQAVVFDVGGVLEVTPPLGVLEKWERKLGLEPGEAEVRLFDVFKAGSIGTISEHDVHCRIADLLELDQAQLKSFMDDVWREYLGTLNIELVEYFRRLRPRHRTAILSNSFVGARAKERERYGFEDMTDLIIYSHEVGMSKPDPRVYELTCEQLCVQPEETVFLDNVKAAVDGAQKVGMHGILFTNNAQAIADIDAHLTAR